MKSPKPKHYLSPHHHLSEAFCQSENGDGKLISVCIASQTRFWAKFASIFAFLTQLEKQRSGRSETCVRKKNWTDRQLLLYLLSCALLQAFPGAQSPLTDVDHSQLMLVSCL